MSRQFLRAMAMIAVATAGATLLSGQGASPSEPPNFEGIWNSPTATPLERPREMRNKAVFTAAEAAEFERDVARRNEEPAPAVAKKGQGTGTYNTFFREFGTRVVKTRRTSIVIDPPDGRIPALTAAADALRQQRLEQLKRFAHPEDLGLQDRCVAFSTAGPPMLPYSYNSNYQIVQTPEAIAIHAEMIHDTRIIYLDGRAHPPPQVRQWLGDSVGRWEGRTLVVDTTNFPDGNGYYGDAGGNFAWDRNLHLIERFSLFDAETLLYRFEIDDPTAYTRRWTGELTLTRSAGPIYEFACHEANYALTNMLRGYRAIERK